MMWKLTDMQSGEVIRHGLATAWQGCKGMFHSDGSPYHLNQVISLNENLVVYRKEEIRKNLKIPRVSNTGEITGEYNEMCKVQALYPCLLSIEK